MPKRPHLTKAVLISTSVLAVGSLAALGLYPFGLSPEIVPTLSQELSSKHSTYLELLKNRNFIPITEETEEEVIKNLMLERMFPNYQSNHTYRKDQLFKGSPEIKLTGSYKRGANNKKIFVFEKDKLDKAKDLKEACLTVLAEEANDSYNSLSKLAEWCTVPKVKMVLKRHKFAFNETDEDWQKIIHRLSPDLHNYQSFLSEDEIRKIIDHKGNGVELLKNKCKAAFDKDFVRANFPSPKVFLNGKDADEFQEAALFCTKERTAEDYVQHSMQGKVKTKVPEKLKGDFCYVQGQDDINYYKNIKTTDLTDGKGFWCAVRIVYDRHKSTR